MDATPVTLGQEFGGYAAAVRLGVRAGDGRRWAGVAELPLGGTAVGHRPERAGRGSPPG